MKVTTYSKFILFACCFALLAGCAQVGNRYAANKRLPLSANEYLQLAASSQGDDSIRYQLLAATRFLQDRKPNNAQPVIDKIAREGIPANYLAQRQLLQADIYLQQDKPNRSVSTLNDLVASEITLSGNQRVHLYQSYAKAYREENNIPASITARSKILGLKTNGNLQRETINLIWEEAQSLSPQQLTVLTENNQDSNLRGWLSLALITKERSADSNVFLQKLARWRANYSSHPAQNLLPSNLPQVASQTTQPKHIALLLPMKGSLESAASAIKNGFFAAYYYSKSQHKNPPSIKVYDTSNQSIVHVYNKAIEQGADFVVGPLTKPNIAKLVKSSRLTVPTLALNSVPSLNAQTNLYQFGLSPQDEAFQAAQRAWNDEHSRALIIAPNDEWGQGIVAAFRARWQQLGGQVVGELNYTDQASLAKEIKQLLNVDLAYSQKHELRRILHQKIRYIPRRREDADVIFMVANSSMARQIRPLLKFYFAGSIPVYATSQVYAGLPDPRRDHDLNGIIFPDSPWVLSPMAMQPQALDIIQRRIRTLWPNSFHRYPKLYALGVDAYDVIPNLDKMRLLPQIGTDAASGRLYLTGRQHLYRQLLWSQMTNGKPKVLTK